MATILTHVDVLTALLVRIAQLRQTSVPVTLVLITARVKRGVVAITIHALVYPVSLVRSKETSTYEILYLTY